MPGGPDGEEGQAGEDPRKRDYAIIVGVTRYPKLSRDGASADLRGSIKDAEKVRAWIESDKGGGVPQDHVEYVIRADEIPAGTADPTRDKVVEAFTNMYARCWPNGSAGAPKVPTGRRLYVYVSGHGLAVDQDHGALLCSNSSDNLYSTVAPYASIKAFRQAGFFEQFVVWFDGCMDWVGLEPESINYVPRPGNSLLPPGPVFAAYAAHPRLKAMESPDDSGEVRGVFTRTLLAGLEGGAVDPDKGEIDGLSLATYLWNAMPKYLPASAKDNVLIDKQPSVTAVPGIIFGKRMNIVKKSPVVLRFGAERNGAEARVWGRQLGGQQSLSLLATLKIEDGEVKFALPNGIYAVDVPQFGLRTGFEITGGAVTKLLAD
jgi:Caspase domain